MPASELASDALSQSALADDANVPLEVVNLINRCPTLPSLPSAYLRLVEAMNDPYSAGGDFARIIEEDAGLTTRVLKLVNSSMYGMSQMVDSVSRALSILGIEPLHDLIIATSAVSAFEALPQDLVDMESFWKHSLATAVVSRLIGAKRESTNVEALFVCGLLHDLGRLIFYMVEPARARDAHKNARESGDLLYVVERGVFGFDHAVVGTALLRLWGLPETLSEPIKFHHEPESAGSHAEEAAIVHVADIIAHALMFGSSGEHHVPKLCASAWETLEGPTWFDHRLLTDVEHQFHTAVHGVLG